MVTSDVEKPPYVPDRTVCVPKCYYDVSYVTLIYAPLKWECLHGKEDRVVAEQLS